jgi:copper chaperone
MSPRTEHEDGGRFLGFVHNDAADRTAPVIFDAEDLDRPAVATVHVRRRMPLRAPRLVGPNNQLKGSTTMSLPRQQFAVSGMSCSHCQHAVTAEVSRLAGVMNVAVDIAAGTVTIECTRWLDYSEVSDAIDDAGYEMAA